MPRRPLLALALAGAVASVAQGRRTDVAAAQQLQEHIARSQQHAVADGDVDLAYQNLWEFMQYKGFDMAHYEELTAEEKQRWKEQWLQFREDYESRQRAMGTAQSIMSQRLPNSDRLQCLRQDDLDMVVPSKESYMLRVAVGRETDTGYDVYLTAESFWLKRIDMTLKMTRRADAEVDFDAGDRVWARKVDGTWAKALITRESGTVFTLVYDVDDVKISSADRTKTADQLKPLGKAFDIEITGGASTDEGSDLAFVDFELAGLTPKFRSKLMSMGLGLVSNTNTLTKRQRGTLHFKLSARGIGAFDHSTGMWEVKLLKKKLQPLSLVLSNQALINSALSAFDNTIEGVVMDSIWSQLHKIIPKSFAALTSEVDAKDLQLTLTADIKGGQQVAGSELDLEVTFRQVIDQNPTVILDALVEKFDVETMVNSYFKALLEEQDLKAMWAVNKEAVAAMLSRYGVDAAWVNQDFNETALKEQLLVSVKKSADAVLVAMKPFINARERGLGDPFAGISAAFGAEADWDVNGERQGRCQVTLSSEAPGARGRGGAGKLLTLPNNFFKAVAATAGEQMENLVVPPREGHPPSVLQLQDLKFGESAMSVDSLRVTGLRLTSKSAYNTTDETTGAAKAVQTVQTWKVGGGLKKLRVRIPKSWDPYWSADWSGSRCELASSGDLTMSLEEGLVLTQHDKPKPSGIDTPEKLVSAHPRKGSVSEITGPVPEEYKRPLVENLQLEQDEMAPKVNIGLGIKMSTKEYPGASHFILEATGSVHASINVNDIIRPLAAARPSEDTGYMFFGGGFKLEFQGAVEEESARTGKLVKVVLNCGYLRVYDQSHFGREGFEILKFDNWGEKDGQLQVDLSQMQTAPKVESVKVNSGGTKRCLKIHERQWKSWFLGSSKTESSFLCVDGESSEADLERLAGAMKQQVVRFTHDTALSAELNFGTHHRYDAAGNQKPQYPLPPTMGTKQLAEILKLPGFV